jgi:hypothetical protein
VGSQPEVCDAVDNNCDGQMNEGGVCGPNLVCTPNANCNTGLQGVCALGTCASNGLSCQVTTAPGSIPENTVGTCNDFVDNDCDGATDCNDTGCATQPACVSAVTNILTFTFSGEGKVVHIHAGAVQGDSGLDDYLCRSGTVTITMLHGDTVYDWRKFTPSVFTAQSAVNVQACNSLSQPPTGQCSPNFTDWGPINYGIRYDSMNASCVAGVDNDASLLGYSMQNLYGYTGSKITWP